jgi:hypothetical protein
MSSSWESESRLRLSATSPCLHAVCRIPLKRRLDVRVWQSLSCITTVFARQATVIGRE